jgi:membrane protein required for colicin V production
MNWVDWFILAVIGLSTLLSLWRGFVKEALSLAAWVVAFFVSMAFATRLSAMLHGYIASDELRYAAAYVILFAATLMLGAMLNRLLAELIKMTGLSGLDRALGTVFGFARGIVVVVVAVFVIRSLLPEVQAVEQSRLLPQVMMVVQWAETNLAFLVVDGPVSLPWA